MKLNPDCMKCQFDRQFRRAMEQNDPEKARLFIKDMCRIISEVEDDSPAPVLTPRFNEAFERYFGKSDKYTVIKKRSNDYLLAREDELRRRIAGSGDPLKTALKLARVGNYIDYGALGDNVSEDVLDALIAEAEGDIVDEGEYEHFLRDLENGERLVYITDNAGEIVLDKLLIEVIKKQYPDLTVTVLVRGYPIVNDATVEDCEYVGLDRLVRCVGNGSHIAGTFFKDLDGEVKELLNSADVIVAKGQGNFETMFGCMLNVYYVFLCKCQLFRSMFGVPQLTRMFVNEKRLKIKN
ncbi:MAG: DUF89 family protein [Oscillospiraceae bacterium]|nr:DUF89 family protein [Oscillospiraceae bacterium]